MGRGAARSQEPSPAAANRHCCVRPSKQAAKLTSPSRETNATATLNTPTPASKFEVPSIGSTTQFESRIRNSSALSSPRKPACGTSSRSERRKRRSAARSATVAKSSSLLFSQIAARPRSDAAESRRPSASTRSARARASARGFTGITFRTSVGSNGPSYRAPRRRSTPGAEFPWGRRKRTPGRCRNL